ncbi:ABC transporter permease, partial [Tritonibacter sp. SIMBA_163]
AKFPETAQLPLLPEILAPLGIQFSKPAPANVTLFVALAACVVIWGLIWHTPLGHEIRAFGKSDLCAVYAGNSPVRTVM